MNIYNYLLFTIAILFSTNVMADPNDGILDLYIESKTVNYDAIVACVDVTVDDFENISYGQIPLKWDPEKLSFSEIALEAFGNAIQVVSEEQGNLRYIVQDATLENPLSLEDGDRLFEICFDIIDQSTFTDSIKIELITDPLPSFPLEFTNNEGFSIPVNVVQGTISYVPVPVSFCLDSRESMVGDTICYSLYATNFTEIQTFQFSLDYDVTQLKYIHSIEFNTDIKITEFDIFVPQLGNIRVSWFDVEGVGKTIEDCSQILVSCFEVLSEETNEESLTVGENFPGGSEATNAANEIVELNATCGCMLPVGTSAEALVPVTCYPNPAGEILTINVESHHAIQSIKLYDYMGSTYPVVCSQSDSQLKLNTADLGSGQYILKIVSEKGTSLTDFIKI